MGNIRTPQQKRSEATRQRIIAAAENLFSQKGYYHTNSKEIAKAAGVSIGSFYSYFTDKKALFIENLTQYSLKIFSKVLAPHQGQLFAGKDKQAVVNQLIFRAIEAHEYSPEFHRQTSAMRYMDADVAKVRQKEEQMILHYVIQSLRSYDGNLRVTDVEAAAVIVVSAVESVVHMIKIDKPEIEEHRLITQLSEMITRYLFD
ncbi:MAG: TetR/AcrR family transcriptional regulator [Thermodesulfobacteriota bacterium]|nr:TetR/AcrR family transcriptional regulator [Thermodesulfobacteriota bacterium]